MNRLVIVDLNALIMSLKKRGANTVEPSVVFSVLDNIGIFYEAVVYCFCVQNKHVEVWDNPVDTQSKIYFHETGNYSGYNSDLNRDISFFISNREPDSIIAVAVRNKFYSYLLVEFPFLFQKQLIRLETRVTREKKDSFFGVHPRGIDDFSYPYTCSKKSKIQKLSRLKKTVTEILADKERLTYEKLKALLVEQEGELKDNSFLGFHRLKQLAYAIVADDERMYFDGKFLKPNHEPDKLNPDKILRKKLQEFHKVIFTPQDKDDFFQVLKNKSPHGSFMALACERGYSKKRIKGQLWTSGRREVACDYFEDLLHQILYYSIIPMNDWERDRIKIYFSKRAFTEKMNLFDKIKKVLS